VFLVEMSDKIERRMIEAPDRGRALAAWLPALLAFEPARLGPGPTAGMWRRLLEGQLVGLHDEVQATHEAASRDKAAALLVETAILRALVRLGEREVARATEEARRASLMAQAEGVPELELLAGLVLARARRHAGRPHLGLYILELLARALPKQALPAGLDPEAWRPWLAWELALCGATEQAAAQLGRRTEGPASRACGASRALGDLLAAARAGDRPAFTATSLALRGATASGLLAAESEAVIAALDMEAQASPEVEAWRCGASAAIPAGLQGLGVASDGDELVAYVVAWPGRPGRRVLRAGLALLADVARLVHPDAGDAGERADTGVACLLLAGPAGLPREEFFRLVYGFPFVYELHQGVLDVLVHRMRSLLPAGAAIAREEKDDGPRLRLTIAAPLLVPDARCVRPIADRVLRVLAAGAGLSAQETAEALRVPLRTVQKALQRLVADGALAPERDGRRMSYRVQDTAFTRITVVDTARESEPLPRV
jgi:hypothetical protein